MVLPSSGDAQRCSHPGSEGNYDSLAPDAARHVWQGRSKRFVK
jgi:hypothetical protein